MTVFRYGREHFEEGEYVRRLDARPGDDLDAAAPAGLRAGTEDYALADCKLTPLISII